MADQTASKAGLYLHIPFCASICPYCDFAVMKGDRARRESFVESLVAEIELCGDFTEAIDTVYFGGGTPSLLPSRALEGILDATRQGLEIESEAWIGLEANPEDVDAGALASWRALGVSMLSLGVQSFDDRSLELLGRSHDAARSWRSARESLDAGFDAVSIDLIYGLPGQTLEGWQRDLDAAIELGPQHISCYQLTVHEQTVFGVLEKRGRFRELDSARQADYFYETHRRLAGAGYEAYEVSNFAVAPELQSRHNRKYWDHTPYLGVGPSAHSFDGRKRWWNERKERPWALMVRAGERPVAGVEELSPADLVLERLMLGLRTREGVNLDEIQQEHGIDLDGANAALISELERDGFLERRTARVGTRLAPTLAGMAIADTLAGRFEIPGSG